MFNFFGKEGEAAPIVSPTGPPSPDTGAAPGVPAAGPAPVAPAAFDAEGKPLVPIATTVAPVAPVGLDRLQQLLDNDPNAGKPPVTPAPDDTPFDPVALLQDPEAMSRITDAIDFSGAITPETQELLQSNDPKAIMALVQDVGKQAYASALKHSSVLASQQLEDRLSRMEKTSNDQISTALGKHELARELPQMSNPLIAMAVDGFQEKLQAQNPSMTKSQVALETRTYLKELSVAVNPPKTPDLSADPDADGVDWFEELGIKV